MIALALLALLAQPDLAPPEITGPSGLVGPLPVVTGRSAFPVLTITLYVDGAPAGSARSTPSHDGRSGVWILTPAAPLADGAHVLTAVAELGKRRSPPSAPVSIVVDRAPPTLGSPLPAQGAVVPAAGLAVSVLASDAGAGIDPASAAFRIDGAPLAGVVVGPAGFSAPAPGLAPGAHSAEASVRDLAGNPASLTWSFTIEGGAPPVPPPPAPLILSPVDGQILGASPSAVSGSAAASAVSVAVWIDGAPAGSAPVLGGSWSLPLAVPPADGTRVFRARASNAGGESPDSAPVAVVVDTLAPAISGMAPSGGVRKTSPFPALSATLSDAGSGVNPASVVVALNGIVVPATLTPAGPGSFDVAFTPPAALAQGPQGWSILCADAAGHVAGPATASFSVDTQAPLVEIGAPPPASTQGSASIALQAAARDSGSGIPPGGVRVLLNGADVTGLVSVTPSAGGWTISGALTGVSGPNPIEVRATDLAGLTHSDVATVVVELPPGGPTLTAIQPPRAGRGARIRLTGAGLTAPGVPTVVRFAPSLEVGALESATSNELMVRVPDAAVTGPVSVAVGDIDGDALPFEVLNGWAADPQEERVVFGDGAALCALNDVMVRLQPLLGPDDAAAIAADAGATVIGYLPGPNVHLFRYPTTTLPEIAAAIDALMARPEVMSAWLRFGLAPLAQQDPPAVMVTRYKATNSEGRTGFWGFDRIQAPAAWSMLKRSGRGFSAVKMAIFDSGVDNGHIEFAGTVEVKGFGPAGEAVPWTGGDRQGHGTAVAGVIAARNDEYGISGVLTPPTQSESVEHELFVANDVVPYSTRERLVLMADKFYLAMSNSAKNGVRVMNVSTGMGVQQMVRQLLPFGAGLSQDRIRAMVLEYIEREILTFRYAVQDHPKVLVVVCAGNDETNLTQFYGLYGSVNTFGGGLRNLIVAGGIQHDDNRWVGTPDPEAVIPNRGSSYGNPPHYLGDPVIDLAAPASLLIGAGNAREVFREGPDASPYFFGSGTSASAAFISGAASLLFSYAPGLEPADVKRLLTESAHRVRVELPDGARIEWATLKLANAVQALLTRLGTAPADLPEGTDVFVPRLIGTTQGTSRTTRMRWDPALATYKADDAPHLINLYETYSVTGLGHSLFITAYGTGRSRSDLREYELPSPALSGTMPGTNHGDVYCDGIRNVVNIVEWPHALNTGAVLAQSMEDFACGDPARFDFYLLTFGERRRLTQIAPGTLVKGFAGGQEYDFAGNFRLEGATATQDGRWMLFANPHPSDPGHLYLLPISASTDPKHVTLQSVGAVINDQEHRFPMAALNGSAIEGVSHPAVSPDGTRVAWIDRGDGRVRIGTFEVAYSTTQPFVRPQRLVRSVTTPAQSHFFNEVAWSPDGSHLAFTKNSDNKIYVIPTAAGEYADQNNVRVIPGEMLDVPGYGGSWRPIQWAWRN